MDGERKQDFEDTHVYLLGKYYCLLLDYEFLEKKGEKPVISSNLFLSLLLLILSQYPSTKWAG